MSFPIVAEEQALLTRIRRLLAEHPPETGPKESDLVAELVRLRDEIPTAKEEDKPALTLQYESQLTILDQLRANREKPEVDPDSPYFGHLRVVEEGKERDLCVGKATRIGHGLRIVDWRNAPVSRLYYRYQEGDEYEERFGDRVVSGEILARRTLAIRRGTLERIESPDGTFVLEEDGAFSKVARPAPRLLGGQGATMAVYQPGEGGAPRRLGTDLAGHRRRVDKRLPDIAGLIDPEQFELITKPSSGYVVIRGSAGSGKTTVALHRIAYMAYEDPEINSNRTLFLVFSRALRDYVGHVLPALGVPRVRTATFAEWATEQRKRHFPHLPRAIRESTPALISKIKLHPAMIDVLEAQVHTVNGPANGEQAADDWASALVNVALLKEHLGRDGAFRDDELERFAAWCRDRHDELVAAAEGDDTVEPALDEEDQALLLRAWQLRVGALRDQGRKPLQYRHVAIDEVQDLSPLEVRVLLDCLDARRSVTLAGDTQQHVMVDAGFTSWADFFAKLGLQGTAVNTLRVAYRSSAEVVHLAVAVLGPLREDEPPLTVRSGPVPELFRFTDHGAVVGFLADALKALLDAEPLASVVVLCPTPELSALYARGLQASDVPHLRRVTDEDFSFSPGVEVTEVNQVKGLEFDYVVLVEVSDRHYPLHDAARRLLHVGITRAVHQLWMTSVEAPSPILVEAGVVA